MESLLNELTTLLKTIFANPITLTAIACLVFGYMIRPLKWLSNDFIPPLLFIGGGFLFFNIGDNSLFPPEAAHLGVWKFLAGAIIAFLTWTFHYAVLSKRENVIPGLAGFLRWADNRTGVTTNTTTMAMLAASLIILTGCSSFYSATVTLTQIVDSASKEYAHAYNDGLISPETDAKVAQAHASYQKSAKTAASALRAYKLSGDPTQYDAAFEATRVAALQFVNLIAPLISKEIATDLQKKTATVKQL